MKVLYVLVSDGVDYYYEQALVSITSLKLVNPDVFITLVVDDLTDLSLIGNRERIKTLVNEYKRVDFDSAVSLPIRSRFLKTSTRELVKGDFLYVDVDTVWAEALSEKDFSSDVMAVLDGHRKVESRFCSAKPLPLFEILGYDPRGKDYVNSGVMFWKDSDCARKIQRNWHELWNRCASLGYHLDQPSLNKAIENMDYDGFGFLNGIYNAQIITTWDYLFKAKIIHYFSSLLDDSSPYIFLKQSFWVYVKEHGVDEYVSSLLDNPRGAFEKPFKVCNQDDLQLQQTRCYGLIKDIYCSRGKKITFALIEKILMVVSKIFNLFSQKS